MFKEFSRPSKVFGRREREALRKFAEVLRHYLNNSFRQFLNDANDAPALMTYGSDGTELIAQHTVTAGVPPPTVALADTAVAPWSFFWGRAG